MEGEDEIGSHLAIFLGDVEVDVSGCKGKSQVQILLQCRR
jgi:hypothetical protein